MDCNHARLLMSFAREHADLDQSEADSLAEHLGLCSDCAGVAASERRFDLSVGRAMRAVPVPPGLKDRLLAGLVRTPFRWRRWLLGGAAVAAAVLLSVGLSWYFWLGPRQIDPYDLPVEICTAVRPSPPEVEQWFHDRGKPMVLHPLFRHELLDAISIADFQRRRVPKLEYTFRDNQGISQVAHVFVLSPKQFDVDGFEVPSPLRALPSRNVEALWHDGYLYLVVYTGDTLRPFFR